MTISEGFDGPLHPLLWLRLPGSALVPATPRNAEEALGMMERCHAAAAALLHDEPVTDGETVPLSLAWFAAVREACARTGPVPGVERYLLEWWVTDPPADGLTQLPWLFGVWQGHWVCWAGTTPWAAADQRVTTAWDRDAFEVAVRFGADPEDPPADPWTVLGTSALAVPTVILLALAGKPATGRVRLPVTPTPAPEPEPEPEPEAAEPEAVAEPEVEPETMAEAEPEAEPEAAATEPVVPATPPPSLDVLEGRIPPPPGAPGGEPPALPPTDDATEDATGPEDTATDDAPADAAEPEAAEAAAPVTEELAAAAVAEEPVTAPVAPIEPPTTPPAPMLPPASWYTDPTGRHQLRYWDGSQWTAHAADQATGQVLDPI